MGLWDKVVSGASSLGSTLARTAEAVENKVSSVGEAAEKVEAKAVDLAKSEFEPAKDFSKVTGRPADLHTSGAGRSDFSDPVKMEKAVLANKARDAQWSVDDIKKDPDAFLKNVVQLDGNVTSKDDYTACGPTSMLMGMIAGRPESVPELAGKLIDDKGNLTDAGKKMLGKSDGKELKDSLTRMRNGKFSAADVTQLADHLLEGMPQNGANGTDGTDLIRLRAEISKLGVSVPRMELQRFGDPDGGVGHWRVGINGKQYNPWPDSKGQSSVITGSGGLADGVADGASAGKKPWVTAEKIYIDDSGASRNVYALSNKPSPNAPGTTWSVQSDPPLFVTTYQKQADGTFKQTGVDAGRFRQLAPSYSWQQITSLFPDATPR